MGTFHVLRTFTLAANLFTKLFLEWLKSYEKICGEVKKNRMIFGVVNHVKDVVLDCFLFENIKHFLVKKNISLFLVPVATHYLYKTC